MANPQWSRLQSARPARHQEEYFLDQKPVRDLPIAKIDRILPEYI